MIGNSEDPLFSFVILGDTHITEEDGCSVDLETTLKVSGKFETLLDKIEALDPSFIVHLGDVTHPSPGSDDYPAAARKFIAMSERIGRPWYLVPGNHDIGEKLHRALPELDDAVSITTQNIETYEQNFGPQYQSFEHQNCVFILINSLLINSGLRAELSQWDWLEKTMSANAGKRLFVCSHYPMFLTEENEAEHYDNIGQPGRARLASLMRKHRVEVFYAGHAHNFFYNQLDKTHHFTLPSTSILRHDYLELFRSPPENRQLGRYDPAKTGFFWVEVFKDGHIPHFCRQNALATLRTHSWQNKGSRPVMDLRMPWCDRQEVSSPWGAEIFERKRVRNDYPLAALWELGVRDVRIPVSDLENPETARRVKELAALGHRFTTVMFGAPSPSRHRVLQEHADVLRAIEVVELRDRFPSLVDELGALRVSTGCSVFLNPTHAEVQGYTSTHGLRIDSPEDTDWLHKEVDLRNAVDGIVIGVPQQIDPLDALTAAQEIVGDTNLALSLHVQNVGMYRTTVPTDPLAIQRELNRVVEAAVLARAYPEISVTLDNFIAQDRGYFHCFGLIDRLCNPRIGSQALRHLDASLPPQISIVRTGNLNAVRVIEFKGGEGEMHFLLLPDNKRRAEATRDSSAFEGHEATGLSLDLITGQQRDGALSEAVTDLACLNATPTLFKAKNIEARDLRPKNPSNFV